MFMSTLYVLMTSNNQGFTTFGTFGSDSMSDSSNKGTSYWISGNKDHVLFGNTKF